MPLLQDKSFSSRDWLGLVAGIVTGAVLGCFFSSDDMTGVWLVVLLGPPVMLVISPGRPLVGWQVPIVAAAASSALLARDSQGTAVAAYSDAAIAWFVCTLFSWPWFLIFHHRNKRANEQNGAKAFSAPYAGLGVLVFLACALTIVGFAMTLYPASSEEGNSTLPFYGFLMATGGVGLSATSFTLARRLGVKKPITDMFQLLLLLPSICALAILIDFVWERPRSTATPASSSHFEIWCALAGLESLALLIWLTTSYRREQIRRA